MLETDAADAGSSHLPCPSGTVPGKRDPVSGDQLPDHPGDIRSDPCPGSRAGKRDGLFGSVHPAGPGH